MQGEQPKQEVGGGSSNQLAGLKARLDEMSRLLAEMQAARSSGTRVRVGIMVVLLAVVLGFVLHMYNFVRQYPVAELQAQMQAQFLNANAGAMKELIAMAQGLMPVYREEIRKEFSKAWPDIKAQGEAEAKRLMESIPKTAEAKVRARLEGIAKREENRLMEAFPEIKDDKTREIIMTNLETALQSAVLNVFEKRLASAQEQLLDVQEKTLRFVPEEDREAFLGRMQALWDQLLLYELGGREHLKE